MSIQKLMESLSHQTIPDSTLYVIGTPIGNMGDISLRALHILGLVDAVACEDTRVTRNLLSFYGLSKELISAHQHNEREIAAKLIDRLRNGDRIALVSDAGTPAVSDPGAKIVDTVRQSGLNVIPIPGPSAAITALSASGFPDKHFLFVGFLPTRACPTPGVSAEFEKCQRNSRYLRSSAPHQGNPQNAGRCFRTLQTNSHCTRNHKTV